MNRSVNVQRSASSQSPATPPRRTARPPLSPKNNQVNGNLRRHHIPLRRSEQSSVTPHTQSLAQANARLIHERLQQNHNRLQVQLHARPPAASAIAGPVKTFLDTTFRAYASRIQTEFTGLRAACARAVQREQHQTAAIRNTCARLTRERDVAEEKLRVLLDQQACATKRTRSEVEKEDADAETTGLMYPPSPVSPPQLPIGSPPPRLMSPFMLAAHRSPSQSPGPEDRTGFDLTVSCDSLPRPSKKRRVSASPERASATAYGDKTAAVTKERETCPPAAPGFGECDMDLESESDSDSSDSAEADATYSSKSKSQPSSRAASSSPPAEAEAETSSPLQQRPTPPPPMSPARVRLHLECVDIMYLPTNGKLVCRVCLLATSDSTKTFFGPRPAPVTAFLPGASWDMLRTHCEEAHPEACRDVVGLGQAGVQELRRRLGLGMGAQP